MQNQPSLNADYPPRNTVIHHYFRRKTQKPSQLLEIKNPNKTIKNSFVRVSFMLYLF